MGDQLKAKGATSLSDQLRQMVAAQSGQQKTLDTPAEQAQGEAGAKAGVKSGVETTGMMLGGELAPATKGLFGAMLRMFSAGAGAGAGNAAGQAITSGKVDPVETLKQAAFGAGTQGVAEGVSGIPSAIPSAERAGAALGQLKKDAGNIPVNVDKIRGIVGDLVQNESTGGTLPSAVKKFVTRVAETGPNNPLNYADAKDFQSNISALTASDKMGSNANTKRLVTELNSQLKGALKEATDVIGKGDTFTQAMQEYHQAMKLAGWKEDAIEHGWKVALGALFTGGVAKYILDK